MSILNANATEWRPVGVPLTDILLPSATAMEGGRAMGDGSTPEFVPQQPPLVDYMPSGALGGGSAAVASVDPPAYYPKFFQEEGREDGGEMGDIDWDAEFKNVMRLTGEMIDQQLNGENDREGGNTEATSMPGEKQSVASTSAQRPRDAGAASTPSATNGSAAAAAASASAGNDVSWSNVVKYGAASRSGGSTAAAAAAARDELQSEYDSHSLAPLTANGNRRWKKPTKAQQKRELAQKNAFEAFANALLHSVSPFMEPLRRKCRTSLPHIKVDQRFGRSGQPQTATAQFIVAPLVTNYRPRHFHDIPPGDLMEFHYDFGQVLKQIKSAHTIVIGYGPVWKRYAVPFSYVACSEYAKEVLALCPHEIPNSRSEAVYADDIVKNITDVILAVEELQPLQEMSILQAMHRRVNLVPMYDAFDAIFSPLENYQIEICNLHEVPSTFLLKTSKLEVEQKPQPIVLYGDESLWNELPNVNRYLLQTGVGTGSASAPNGMIASASSSSGVTSSAAGKKAAAAKDTHGADKSAKVVGERNRAGINWGVALPLLSAVLVAAATAAAIIAKESRR